MANVLVKLENISKSFGDKKIIDNLSLDIYEGEFITFLGPSGCGKTTVLRMISGLEEVTSGKVFIDNVDVTNIPPTKRKVNTIFQNFALFPHMTVWENINFGLKINKIDQKEAKKRIEDVIKLVQLEGFQNRYPSELSGGQQQRVAIARGLVMKHKVLLLDESLCSLDLKLKREMQIELKRIQKKLGITFIYVTHDQDEALTMSDRIAIINNGIIEQLGTPKEIYKHPKTPFIADFIGESNILDSVVTKIDNNKAYFCLTDDITIEVENEDYVENKKAILVIRPENFNAHKNSVLNSFKGVIKDYVYDGSTIKLEVQIGIIKPIIIKINVFDNDVFDIGDEIYVDIDKSKMTIIGGKDEKE